MPVCRWGACFVEMVESVLQYARTHGRMYVSPHRPAFVWLDVFAVNQHDKDEDLALMGDVVQAAALRGPRVHGAPASLVRVRGLADVAQGRGAAVGPDAGVETAAGERLSLTPSSIDAPIRSRHLSLAVQMPLKMPLKFGTLKLLVRCDLPGRVYRTGFPACMMPALNLYLAKDPRAVCTR